LPVGKFGACVNAFDESRQSCALPLANLTPNSR
jgi:hypothetical protein